MKNKPNILFVCTVNRMRSATAQKIFASDPRFEVDSAGTDELASTVIDAGHLDWADVIIVMEAEHRSFIKKKFPGQFREKKIICLNIPDRFYFLQPELIEILKFKVEAAYRQFPVE